MARPMEGHLAHPLGSSRPLGTSLCTPGAAGAGCPFASKLSCRVTAKLKGAAERRLLAWEGREPLRAHLQGAVWAAQPLGLGAAGARLCGALPGHGRVDIRYRPPPRIPGRLTRGAPFRLTS